MRRLLLALIVIAGLMLATAGQASASSPMVTVNQAAGQADPTSTTPIQFTAVFSSSVTGFTAGDVNLSQSTAGGTLTAVVTGSSTTYTISVSGMTTAGNVIATIPAGAAHDGSNQTSLASTSTDNTVAYSPPPPPTVTVDQAASQPDPTSTSPINFTAVFSESVTGFTAADVSLASSTAGGTLTAVVTGSSTTYTISVSGMTTAGNVIATIPAGAAQNGSSQLSTASTSTDNTVAWAKPLPPTVTVNQAASQPDPTPVSPIQFTAVFSAPVTGFTNTDVNLSQSTAGGTLKAAVTGSSSSYTISVSGMTTAGNVIATIPAGPRMTAPTRPASPRRQPTTRSPGSPARRRPK